MFELDQVLKLFHGNFAGHFSPPMQCLLPTLIW